MGLLTLALVAMLASSQAKPAPTDPTPNKVITIDPIETTNPPIPTVYTIPSITTEGKVDVNDPNIPIPKQHKTLPLVQDTNGNLAICLDCDKIETTANPQNTDGTTANQHVFRALWGEPGCRSLDLPCDSDKDCCSGLCSFDPFLSPDPVDYPPPSLCSQNTE